MKCYSILHLLTFVLYYTSIFVASTDGNEEIPDEIKDLSEERKKIYLELKKETQWANFMNRQDKDDLILFLTDKKSNRKELGSERNKAELERNKAELEYKKFDLALDWGAYHGLLCAMNFYKFISGHTMHKFGVFSINVAKTKFPVKVGWPDRIQKIRTKNDHCWEQNRVNEAIYWTTSATSSKRVPTNGNKWWRGHNFKNQNWEKSDNKSFFQWAALVICDPEQITFETVDGKPVDIINQREYQEYAKKLQMKLKECYDSLPPEDKNKYSNVTQFSLVFAAIMVRNYRFSCYFEHKLQINIFKLHNIPNPDGTVPDLPEILKQVERNWYFDDELMRLPSVLLPLIDIKGSFYIGGSFINALDEHVIIPAYDGCPKSNPSEQWKKTKHAQFKERVLKSPPT